MPYRRCLPALLAVLPVHAPVPAYADPVDLSGSMRVRYEAIANQPRAGFGQDDDLVNLRTTLAASWDTGPVTLAGELWDSRVYAEDPGTPISTGEVNAVELVQAYALADVSLGAHAKATVQAGRFTVNIGSRRLVAADDYRNTTNGYTGLHAEVTAGAATASLIYVLPQQRRPDDQPSLRANAVAFDHEGFDLVLWGGTAVRRHAIGPVMLEASFYHLGERDAPGRATRARSLDTYGGRVMREPAAGKADVEIEGFYQSGSVRAAATPAAVRLPVAAWFIHADAGYTVATRWQPRLSFEYDRASGDGPGGAYGRFDTLFGMRRADLAPAGLYNAVARTNLSTPGVRIEATPSKRVDLFATYHALWLADRQDAFSASGVRDASGRAGAFAGHQLDGRLRWWVRTKILRFEADAVMLAKGRFLREAPNARVGGTTLYGSLNLTASF